MTRRASGTLALAALLLAGLPAACGFGLAWRLSRGPVECGRLTRFAAARLDQRIGPGARIGHLALAWRHRPVVLLRDVTAGRLRLDHAMVALSLPRLLRGEIRPVALEAGGVVLRLAAGDFIGTGPRKEIPPWLDALREARLDGAIAWTDASGGSRRLSAPRLLLSRRGDAISVSAALSLGGAEVLEIGAGGSLSMRGAGRARIVLGPANPARLAPPASGAEDGAAALRMLDARMRAVFDLEMAAGWRPRALRVEAQAGAGRFRFPGAEWPFDGARLLLDGAPDRLRLREAALSLAPGGASAGTSADGRSRLRLSGEAARGPGGVSAGLTLALDQLAFADLKALWPPGLARNTRSWIVGNITAGTVRNARFRFGWRGADASRLRLDEAGGEAEARDLTVHWLRPMLPATEGRGRLRLRSPDRMEIAIDGACQGGIAVRGSVGIDGLRGRDQVATIHAALRGGAAEALAVLRHPRLRLLSAHPVRLDEPRGALDAALDIRLPLEKRLTVDRIGIAARARLDDLHLGRVLAGLDLDHGRFGLKVDNDGLSVSGPAEIGGIPVTLDGMMDFRAGPPAQTVERIAVSALASDRQLRQAGFDPGAVMRGRAGLHADYRARRDGAGRAVLRAELAEAALAAPPLAWRKPPGAPAGADAVVALRNERVEALDSLHILAPGLEIAGRGERIAGADGDQARLLLDRVAIGGTRAAAAIAWPHDGGVVRARVDGPVLDLSAWPPAPASPIEPSGPSLSLHAAFARVMLAGGGQVRQVRLQADTEGLRVVRGELRTGLPESRLVLATTGPKPGADRHLSAYAADAGAWLHALGMMPGLHGGQLALEADLRDSRPGHPLEGRARLDDFTIDAPAALRLAQALSVYGLPEAARGAALRVAHLVAPFRWSDGTVLLRDARAWNPAIGLTVRGELTPDGKRAMLSGTVIPAYAINSLPGRLPWLGRLFSPEPDGGLFAATYTLRGRLNDPRISVNPLSVLMPGALRSIGGGR